MSLKLQMETVWVSNNVAFLVRYWWTAKDALNRVKEGPDSFDEFKDNDLGSRYVAAVLSGHLEHHNYSAVLLAFASLEEFLTVLCADLGTLRGVTVDLSDLKDRGVPRFRKFIHKVCNIAPEIIEIDWAFLERFAVVRNCIVHANGNKARLADPKSLDRVVMEHPTELSFRHNVKLVVSDDFVTRCFSATEQTSLAVIGYMNSQSNKPPSGADSGVK